MTKAWRPMHAFDPSKPAIMRAHLDGTTFEWHPELWADQFEPRASEWGDGIVNWDGLLLDGWRPRLKLIQ